MVDKRDQQRLHQPSHAGCRNLADQQQVNGLAEREPAHDLVERVTAYEDLVRFDAGQRRAPFIAGLAGASSSLTHCTHHRVQFRGSTFHVFSDLRVFDVSGRLVTTLLDEHRPAGEHVARWDGRDARGATAASGLYFARLEAGGRTETRKMVLMK